MVDSSDLSLHNIAVSLKPGVLDRLLLSKSFLDRIRFQPIAVHERQTLAATLIAAHDAAELAIAAIASQLESLPKNKGNSYLMDYFDPIETKTGVSVHAKDYFSQLNRVRNNLKHEGLYPDSRQWSRVAEFVYQHVTKWCQDFLAIRFGDLNESALLHDETAKRLYDEARQSAAEKDFESALEKIAVALSIVFGENAALRGLTVGIPRSDDAIRLSGFGVHANDFLALQQFLPRVETYGKDAGVPIWKQSEFGHPGNWTGQTVDFCLRTFVDVATKIQGARWIPGALPRSALYDQQIEALKDTVEIWTEIRRDSTGRTLSGWDAFLGVAAKTEREVVRTLKRGETLRAFVSIATESSGDSTRDAFWGGGIKTGDTLQVMSFSTDSKDNLYGKVLASDVKVICVPKDDEFVKKYFPDLPTIPWEAE
jgi:hypothetical protein